MRRLRSLSFEPLEVRKLLSRAHVAAHGRPAVALTVLPLTGTLTVENKASMTSTDAQGDVMSSTPIVGQLGTLGEVRGTWSTESDQYGDYMGPDTLRLHNARGSVVVLFSEQNTSSVQHLAGGATATVHPQLAGNGTRAYARTRESGTITLTTNSARTVVVSMTLTGQGT